MFKTTVTHDGQITKVEILDDDTGKVRGVGSATCSPSDHFVARVGEGIAFGRAVQDYGRRMEQRWVDRSTSKTPAPVPVKWILGDREITRNVSPEAARELTAFALALGAKVSDVDE